MVGFIQQTNGRSAGEMIGVDGRSTDFLHVENAHLFIIAKESQRRVADEIGEGGILRHNIELQRINRQHIANRRTFRGCPSFFYVEICQRAVSVND